MVWFSGNAQRDFSFLASVEFKGRPICTAAIINSKWLVTSRKCIDERRPKYKEEYTVRVGTDFTRTGGVVHNIDKFVPHPEFRGHHYLIPRNNVGLIRTKRTIDFDENTFPVVLAKKSDPLSLDDAAEIGVFEKGTTRGEPKKYLSSPVKFVTIYECEKISYDGVSFSKLLPQNIFCATSNLEICWGEEGAPVVRNGTLIGLITYIHECDSSHPMVFTDVVSCERWIHIRTANLCLPIEWFNVKYSLSIIFQKLLLKFKFFTCSIHYIN